MAEIEIMKQTRQPPSGFTLIELMVALVIIVVAVVGLITSLTTTSRWDAATKERSVATDAARQVMEEIKAQFDTVDEYVAFYQGLSSSFDTDLLRVPLTTREAAVQAYVDAGLPAGASAYDTLAGTYTPSAIDKTMARLQNGQVSVNVTKLNANQMDVSVSVSWNGTGGAASTVTLQTSVGK